MSGWVAVPEGPFDALRQGLRIYRSAAGVLTTQILVVVLVSGVFFIGMFGTHMLPQGRAGAPMPPMGFEVSLFAFAIGIIQLVLQMGSMYSVAQVMDGTAPHLADLRWGLRRGEAWLLAVIVEVVNMVFAELSGLAMQASGLRATGNPKHPFVALHGVVLPLAVMGAIFLVFAVITNTVMLAMATAARYGQPASASLRTALQTFTRGHRRFLWINLAWGLVFFAVMVATGVGAVIMAIVAQLLSQGAAGIVFMRIVMALVMMAIIVLFVVGILAFLAAMLASYVAASGALNGPAVAGRA